MARSPTENRGSKYRGKPINIPFYIKDEDLYIIRLKVRKRSLDGNGENVTSPADLGAQNSILVRRRAAKRFIVYYFPEFYTFLYDQEKFQEIPNADIGVAEALLEEIKSAISIDRLDTDANTKKFMFVLSLNYKVDRKRAELKNAQELPSYEENLAFFNERENISGASSQSTFVIGTILTTNNTLNDGLNAYHQQSEQQAGSIDFVFAQSNTQRIIQFAIELLTKALDTNAPGTEFSASDTMTIYFGSQRHHGEGTDTTLAISRIEYTLLERSLNSQPLKVGYFSNIKYNKTFQDPLTLLVLKNYQLILAAPGMGPNAGGDGTPGNPAGSFFDFMSSVTGGEAGTQWASNYTQGGAPGLGLGLDPANPLGLEGPKEFGNAFLNAAKSMGTMTPGDVINIGDTEALEQGFKTAFSSEELKALKMKIADNPEVFKRVMAEEKNKALDNAIKVADVVSNIAETGPMAIIEKNPVLSLIFKKLGLKEIAKEVMICLLFGAPVEIGRISGAIKNSLVKAKASIYYPPDLPAVAEISKPLIKKEDFEIFAIKGGIKKAILKIIVDTLQQTVMQIIKKLSDLLKYNCPLNNPRASDFGANNINDLVTPPPTTIATPTASGLDYLASLRGLTPAQIRQYLAALSEILSSIDICTLFQRRATVSPELLERILDFNEDYSLAYVKEKLINSSAVMSFFYEVSQFVDVAPLCNEIANEVYIANQENITLCLTPGNMPTDELAELMQLAEDGLELDFPEINLDCPERENFINDPTITVTVPETFNMLAELVELQFIESAEAIKSILLSPTMTAAGPGFAAQMLATLGETGERYADNGWPPKIDKVILGKIIKALDKISDFPIEDCPVDISRILGFDPAAIGEVGETVLDTVQDTMSSPEFTDAIDQIKNTLRGIESAPDGPGGAGPALFTTYKFNSQFFWNFVNYIDIDEINYTYPDVSIPMHYDSTLISDSRTFVSTSVGAFPPHAASASIPIEDNSYKPVEINFNFPGNNPYLFDERTLTAIPDTSNYDLVNHAIGPIAGQCINQQTIDVIMMMNQTVDQYRDDGTTLRGCPGTHGIGSDGVAWSNPLETETPGEPAPGTTTHFPPCMKGPESLMSQILYKLLMNDSDGEPYYANTASGIPALAPDWGVAQGWRPFPTYSPLVYNQLRYSSSIVKKIPLTEMNPVMLSAVKQWMSAQQTRLLPNATYPGIIDDLLVKYENSHNCALIIAPKEGERFPIISYANPADNVGALTDAAIPFRTLGAPLGNGSSPNRLAEWIYNKVMSTDVSELEVVTNQLKIVYPREAPQNPNVFMEFQAAGDFIPKGRFITDIRDETIEQAFEDSAPPLYFQNIYIKRFVDAFGGIVPGGGPAQLDAAGNVQVQAPPPRDEAAEIEAKHFPIVYGILVDNMFNYLARNGVFDAAKLQSLTLFHLNDDCPPDEVADLLDVDGIVKQMIEEYGEASCCPDVPPTPQRKRIRNMIKFGMYLLLIQIHVAQIVLKNIFVFAAFELDTLIENKDNFIFKFLRNQITTSLVSFFADTTQVTENMIRKDLVRYFNKKMLRQCTIEAGGILNSKGEIVFPVGTWFSVTNEGIGFDEILDYYISERLERGRGALNRAIKLSLPDGSPVEMKKALLKSIPTYNVPQDTKQFLLGEPGDAIGVGVLPLVFGTAPRTYQVFLTRRLIQPAGLAGPRSRIILWYYYVDDDGAHLIKLFRFRGTISTYGEPNGFINRVNMGLIEAKTIMTTSFGPCLEQPQINFLMQMVGVRAGKGCPGTHGTDPDGNDWENPMEEAAPSGDDDDDGGPPGGGSTPPPGSSGGGYGISQ